MSFLFYTFVTLWTFIHGKEEPEELKREWDAPVYSTVCEFSRNHEFHGFIIQGKNPQHIYDIFYMLRISSYLHVKSDIFVNHRQLYKS